MANNLVLRIGDEVKWRGCFGRDPKQTAIVTKITVTKFPRDKYGDEVQEIPWSTVNANKAVISLDNGHWAYGEQISQD